MPESIPIHGTCDPRFSAVRDTFRQSLASGLELGAAVSIMLDGENVADLWGGYCDEARTHEWERDTLVPVYSTTKGMTALCANHLIEHGKIDVDAPVAQYWPEFAAGGKEAIPVRWLLNHQAGLPAIREQLPEGSLYEWDRVCGALARQKPLWKPGTRHGYHIVTFGFLVGEVIRRVSEESVGTYFRKNVAEPLGLDFHIGLASEHDARTSEMYGAFVPPPGFTPPPPRDLTEDTPDAAAIWASAFSNPAQKPGFASTREWRAAQIPSVNGHGTARALARVYGTLARGGELEGVRILKPETIDRAITEESFGPDAVLGGASTRFGLGFALRHDLMPLSPNPRAFGHAGTGGSMGMADPDTKVGFGFTLNRMHMGPDGFAGAFGLVNSFYEGLG